MSYHYENLYIDIFNVGKVVFTQILLEINIFPDFIHFHLKHFLPSNQKVTPTVMLRDESTVSTVHRIQWNAPPLGFMLNSDMAMYKVNTGFIRYYIYTKHSVQNNFVRTLNWILMVPAAVPMVDVH